jgi:signal peptidase I
MKKCVIIMLAVCLSLLFVGCSWDRSITDTSTKYDLPLMEQPPGVDQIPYQLRQDGMMRSEQYAGGNTLVVDLHVYKAKSVQRGDVVYYKTNATDEELSKGQRLAFDIARVVAMPGETVSVQKGQIYIDGHKLDTFYGKEHDGATFTNGTKNAYSMEGDIKVTSGHYLLAGDVWWRVGMIEEPVAQADIRGGVVGWMRKESVQPIYKSGDNPMHFMK